jgi:hypothetical protein
MSGTTKSGKAAASQGKNASNHGSIRNDAAIHAHVADLHLVRDAAEGDDGPVLKFKRRNGAQLFLAPRQIADDETASGALEWFAFRQSANVAQAFGHDAASSKLTLTGIIP